MEVFGSNGILVTSQEMVRTFWYRISCESRHCTAGRQRAKSPSSFSHSTKSNNVAFPGLSLRPSFAAAIQLDHHPNKQPSQQYAHPIMRDERTKERIQEQAGGGQPLA